MKFVALAGFCTGVVFVLALFNYIQVPSSKPTSTEESIERVIDGDTIQLETKERVRLLGINCPELSSELGKDAREKLFRRLYWSAVQVERHGKDRYGRTLAYIDLAGQDVGLEMLQWCDEVSAKYPHPRQEVYKGATR